MEINIQQGVNQLSACQIVQIKYKQMHIQLDLDSMFDLDSSNMKVQSKPRTPELSVISEYEQDRFQPAPKMKHYELDSSDIFRSSSMGSAEAMSSQQTFPSTEAMPSHYEQPGERLYYEHRHNLVRKLKDLERWKYEMTQKEKDVLTFAPQINKNSLKILNAREQNPENHIRAKERKLIKIKEYEEAEKLKNYETVKECTFKPKIAKKTEDLTKNRNEDVFENLYHESKMKEIRLKVKQEVIEPPKSPNAQQAVEDFIQRNSQFHQRTKKKMSMLEQKSLQYDLSTGEKLFSPRIGKYNGQAEYSRTGAIFHKNDSLHHLNDKLREKFESSLKGSTVQKDLVKSVELSDRPNIEACFDDE